MAIRILISGREFFPKTITIESKLIDRLAKVETRFTVDLEQQPGFKNVDFKDDIKIFDDDKVIFGGITKYYNFSNNIGYVTDS